MKRLSLLLRGRTHSRGMALVITLAMVTLATVTIVAFLSFVMAEQRLEASRANQTKSELLVKSGIMHVQGLLLSEITDPGRSAATQVNGFSTYVPLDSRYVVPDRKLASVIPHADVNFFNLVRQSVPGSDPFASADSVTLPARNGRKLDTTRWNAPMLLGGNGFTTDDQLPRWIYIDSKNGLSATPTADVIGRIAYNAYDLSGLLNLNVAGFGSSLTDEQLSLLKEGQGAADLTRLGAGVSQADINTLMNFRYPDNPTAADYVARMLGASSQGYLENYNETSSGTHFLQNFFTSRQDLIRYARIQNANFKKALPWLTHFSRSLNSPSWKPPESPVNSNPDLLKVRFPAAATITHYNDKGIASTYPVEAGEPLVQRRFSLAKISWLTPTGPAADISSSAIQAAFGLQWNSGAERWDYVGATGTTALGSILSLAEVAAETPAREPNFFEMLKAGILTGSLGSAVKGKSSSSNSAMSMCGEQNAVLDSNKDLHILKIGANIIDCADTDNYPTILALTFGGVAVERAGVEDLPYFFAMHTTNLRIAVVGSPSTICNISMSEFAWVPELFNPHRQFATATQSPASVRVDIASGVMLQGGFGENTQLAATSSALNMSKDLSVLPPVVVPATKFETFRDVPGPIRDSASPARLGVAITDIDSTLADVNGFHLLSYKPAAAEVPRPVPFAMNDALSKMAVIQVTGTVIRLAYETPTGKYKTYATLGGSEAFPDTTGIDGLYRDDFNFRALKQSESLNNLKISNIATMPGISLVPPDPRGSRYGPMMDRYRRPLGEKPLFTVAPASPHYPSTPQFFNPSNYYQGTTNPKTAFIGNFPQFPSFEDPDYTAALGPRPPDANIGYVSPGTTATAANPYKALATPDPRPVILQRPYRTVAELGYVYRDVPWQTLNFYSNRSADAGLLDLFAVRDEPAMSADRVALTTRHLGVLKALLARTTQKPDSTLLMTDAQMDTVAAQLQSYCYVGGDPASTFPANRADFIPMMSTSGMTTALSTIPIKYRREAITRSMAWSQTRTWNVMVDVIAQVGRFPKGMTAESANFIVEGETRTWSSMAIDRFTGRVIQQQMEKVYE
ncbi:MAG: hypothetical protein ACAI35_08175 [Candidatus Methylacidiphilales bacterium]|nr:hypothetical protein [Candidatus Methylacidiphilales bacterium]